MIFAANQLSKENPKVLAAYSLCQKLISLITSAFISLAQRRNTINTTDKMLRFKVGFQLSIHVSYSSAGIMQGQVTGFRMPIQV